MKLSKKIKSDTFICPRCRSQFLPSDIKKFKACPVCGLKQEKFQRVVDFERKQPSRNVSVNQELQPVATYTKKRQPDESKRIRRGLGKNGISSGGYQGKEK
jgi:predicted  nucleic acid-binding Zn-ribbon protein